MDLIFFAMIAVTTLLGLAALQWGEDSRESSDPNTAVGVFRAAS